MVTLRLTDDKMDMLYMNCVCVLKTCFEDINNNLQHMQELIVNSEPHVPMLSYYKQRNPFLIAKLKILKKQYMMISNTVQMLNTIFSVQLLASMIITFCQISLNLYVYLIQWHDGLVINLNGQVVLIVWACETGKNQAQEIRITIHDVLNRAKDEQIKDEDINSNLQHMQELIVNSEPCAPMLFCYEQRNPFLIMKLKILKKQHMMISNTVQMLNRIFSVQLLASMILTFCQISLHMYIYLIEWHDGLLVISLNGRAGELILLTMIYYIIKWALIAWACETCKNQAQEIRTTIHDVLNSAKDEQIKDELQSFSLQILHRKNIFSSKGFTIDATFLTTMVGTITTYTLILLQFLIISHSCDENSTINITRIM
ncbi:uncharacterized protein [Mycetomoellerius zeteki]|uniref:uncharacterized protein n=1 Tax=Mycetomoellerius zeteki TaxID=64791 RepID=UPI00084EA101|nr:PREDICTED: uncharacterized protein LOC108721975 [Trachymyrmex zeteki]